MNFWAAGAGFSILWDGQLIDDGAINGSGAGQGLGGGSIAGGTASDRPDLVIQNGFENYRYLLPSAGSTLHTLTFRNLGLPAAFGYIPALDTVSLVGVGPLNVPEPPAIALLGIGLLGMTAALNRKKAVRTG